MKTIAVLMLCTFSVVASAAEMQWFGGAHDQDWFNTANWGPEGGPIPTANDKVKLNYVWANAGPSVNDAGFAGEIFISEDRDLGTIGEQSLTIATGGNLITGGAVYGGQVILGYSGADSRAGLPANEGRLVMDGGTMVIGAGATNPGGGHLFVGFGGIGHLEVNAGTLTVLNMFGLGWNGGSATVQLNGGSLETEGWNFGNASSYTFDITGGAWVQNHFWVNEIQALVDAGKITAYGGTGDVVITWDAVNEKTIVTAIPEPATLVLLGMGMLSLLRRKR
ncbi:MAG: PEP-CTERM sorting domain-containing protein [Planctomycetaceae bacterium]|nr:PEP-CTERM sorting domain-containing protein [Planctomycetaceae bacterium]